MTAFYAFCRQIDDLADEPTGSVEERQDRLQHWRDVVWSRTQPVTPVERSLCELMSRYPVTPALLDEIILGMEMDLRGEHYPTYAALEHYCYRVASAVGLVSIEIFGYSCPATKDYAIELGHALQMTNILRDVREDFAKDRIYLPAEDLQRFKVDREDLAAGSESGHLLQLLRFEAERARTRFERAAALLPAQDRPNLLASELMRLIYQTLFLKMERDGFRVLTRRYRLTRWEKLRLLLAAVFRQV